MARAENRDLQRALRHSSFAGVRRQKLGMLELGPSLRSLVSLVSVSRGLPLLTFRLLLFSLSIRGLVVWAVGSEHVFVVYDRVVVEGSEEERNEAERSEAVPTRPASVVLSRVWPSLALPSPSRISLTRSSSSIMLLQDHYQTRWTLGSVEQHNVRCREGDK